MVALCEREISAYIFNVLYGWTEWKQLINIFNMCISLLCLADGPNGKPNEYAAGCGLGWPVLHGIPWNFNTQAFDIYREGLALQVNALYGTTGRRIFMSHRGALGPIIQRISLLQTGDVALVILPSRDKCFLNHLANCSSALAWRQIAYILSNKTFNSREQMRVCHKNRSAVRWL